MSEVINEQDLQLTLKAYANNQIGDKTMHQVFYKLAEHALVGKLHKFDDPKPVINDAADICVAKMHRYRSEKGKAFNFFTTLIMCSFSQSNGLRRNLEKLKNARRNRTDETKVVDAIPLQEGE